MRLQPVTGVSAALMSLTSSHRLVRACTARSTKPGISKQVRELATQQLMFFFNFC